MDAPDKPIVFSLEKFCKIVERIKQGNRATKMADIVELISLPGLQPHYKDKKTKRSVLAACEEFEYPHEHGTCIKLAAQNYDVVLVPKGYFKRTEKKFDVFILREHIFLESDLKCINTTNPDTLGNRIKEGSQQANRVVLDIASSIQKKDLITGLKTGCERNNTLIEILLFYNSRFYCLPKNMILSRKIFGFIKC